MYADMPPAQQQREHDTLGKLAEVSNARYLMRLKVFDAFSLLEASY